MTAGRRRAVGRRAWRVSPSADREIVTRLLTGDLDSVTTAPDLDPYLLPLPTPASPVVLPHLACAVHAHLNGRYARPGLVAGPADREPQRPQGRRSTGRNGPPAFRDEMRLAAWNLINGQLRPTFLREPQLQDAGTPQRARGPRRDRTVEAPGGMARPARDPQPRGLHRRRPARLRPARSATPAIAGPTS